MVNDMATDTEVLDALDSENVSTIEEMDSRNRCDRCGSRAYIATVLTSGNRLDWCLHHFNKHEDALLPFIAEIKDERAKLYEVKKETTVHA